MNSAVLRPASRRWQRLWATRRFGTSGWPVRGCVGSKRVNVRRKSSPRGCRRMGVPNVAPERFLEIFRNWPIGPFPGTTDLLAGVQQSVQIGCLSNTNSMHWEHQTPLWPVLDMFELPLFLSFELGLAKPDEAIFHAVAERLPFQIRNRIHLLRRRCRELGCSSVVRLSLGASSRH